MALAESGTQPLAAMGTVRLLCGDARAVLATLPEHSVHAAICSPPYYQLRSYDGGEAEIGTETSPHDYIAALCAVFEAVRRVLREDGSLWIVIGDCYTVGHVHTGRWGLERQSYPARDRLEGRRVPLGLRPKNLLGIPWRLAFALQDSGWILRQELIWSKKSSMPESVQDRATRSHETIFMLAQADKYFYDADAIREPHTMKPQARLTQRHSARDAAMRGDRVNPYVLRAVPAQEGHPGGRNKRSVWTVSPVPFSGKKYGVGAEHYATFPAELIRPMIKAATSAYGVCAACGAPYVRQVARSASLDPERRQAHCALERAAEAGLSAAHLAAIQVGGLTDAKKAYPSQHGTTPADPEQARLAAEAKQALGSYYREFLSAPAQTVGWRPSCACASGDPVPATILDPFGGAGTTALVARQEGRSAILVDVNASYLDLARARLRGELGLFSGVGDVEGPCAASAES